MSDPRHGTPRQSAEKVTEILNARSALVLYAARQLGRAYVWGGESSEEGGMDCSGFVSHCLTQIARAWPDFYDGRRRTAAGLYDHFWAAGARRLRAVEDLVPGALVFYRRGEGRIYHVVIHATTLPGLGVVGGRADVGPISIGAEGGSSETTSPRRSLLAGAGVRLSASDHHGGAEHLALDPFDLKGSRSRPAGPAEG